MIFWKPRTSSIRWQVQLKILNSLIFGIFTAHGFFAENGVKKIYLQFLLYNVKESFFSFQKNIKKLKSGHPI